MNYDYEYLRKNGQAKAEKKASRIAAEGLCTVVVKDEKTAAVVEVNSETDFVAKNELFQNFVQDVAKVALSSSLNGGKNGEDIDSLLEQKYTDGTSSVKEVLIEKTATIGEKLSIRRFEKVSGDTVVSYIHGGGRIGVLVSANGASDDAAKEALTNIAMQIAALNPMYISDSDVEQSYIDHETEIIKAQIEADPKEAGKPENVKAGMIKGRINKELKEVVLLDQVYVKAEDGKQIVSKYVEEVAKANNANIKIKGFVRFETGEGIEKKEEDFAAEVAAQMQ